MAKVYSYSQIKVLVRAIFTKDEALRRFCYDSDDFRSVYRRLTAIMNLDDVSTTLLQYARDNSTTEQLLATLKELDPEKYARYEPYQVDELDEQDDPLPESPQPDVSAQYLVLNFSGRKITPQQEKAIQDKLKWPAVKVLEEMRIQEVEEDASFVENVLSYIHRLNLTCEDWRSASAIVIVAASYSPVWSVLIAALHGILGHFPNIVHIRRTKSAGGGVSYEVADILPLQDIRDQARSLMGG